MTEENPNKMEVVGRSFEFKQINYLDVVPRKKLNFEKQWDFSEIYKNDNVTPVHDHSDWDIAGCFGFDKTILLM